MEPCLKAEVERQWLQEWPRLLWMPQLLSERLRLPLLLRPPAGAFQEWAALMPSHLLTSLVRPLLVLLPLLPPLLKLSPHQLFGLQTLTHQACEEDLPVILCPFFVDSETAILQQLLQGLPDHMPKMVSETTMPT